MDTWETEIAAILERHSGQEGALLPVLHDIQAAFGHIDDAAKRQVAHALNLSRAEVHGVASFYHDFRDAPAGKPVLRLCRAEACQSRGSEKLAAEAEGMAGDKVTIEPVYCLGLCSVGPNAMIGEEVHARLDAERVSELIAGMAA
jgi:formate dehydrogenase subunit gamma